MANVFSWSRPVIWSTLAVLAGGLIYILFRPSEVVFLQWFHTIGAENWLEATRENSLSLSDALPNWLVYSLPNGLWAFAYTLIILIIWKESNSNLRFLWYLSIPILVFGFELLQLTTALPGTFCRYDLIWGAMGIAVGFLTIYPKNNNLNYLR